MGAVTTPGRLPQRQNTALAEVLARALSGDTLTAIGALNAASSMRLAAHINALEVRYGWHFLRAEKAVGCKDGRVAHVGVYRLDPAAIAAIAAAEWVAGVRRARAARRGQAVLAAKKAASFNAAKAKLRHHPDQLRLFDEVPA